VQAERDSGLFGGDAWGDDAEESVGQAPGKSGPPASAGRGSVPAAGSVRVHDVADLVFRVPNFRGLRIDLRAQAGNDTAANNGSGLFEDDDDDDDDDGDAGSVSRRELVDSILDLIRATIAPDSWRNGPAAGTIGSVRELNGQLIVTQTPENHRSLMDLLQQLREARLLVLPPRLGREALVTSDGRLSEWALKLLARAREGKLSKFSSVAVKRAGGRTFARIAGVWLDTALTAEEEVCLIALGSPGAEAVLKARPGLKACFALGQCVVVRAAPGLAVSMSLLGADDANDPGVAKILKVLSK
jgi:hypothetical protein